MVSKISDSGSRSDEIKIELTNGNENKKKRGNKHDERMNEKKVERTVKNYVHLNFQLLDCSHLIWHHVHDT